MAGRSAPPEGWKGLLEDKTHGHPEPRRPKPIRQTVQFIAMLLTILVAVLVLSADIRNLRADVRALGVDVKTDTAEVKTDTAELRADMKAIQESLVQINNRSFIQIGSGNNSNRQ